MVSVEKKTRPPHQTLFDLFDSKAFSYFFFASVDESEKKKSASTQKLVTKLIRWPLKKIDSKNDFFVIDILPFQTNKKRRRLPANQMILIYGDRFLLEM